jgi:hypothetical protein
LFPLGRARGRAQGGRAEEWRETEPVGNSVPSPARRPPDPGIEDRAELARVLTRDFFPAGKQALLVRLADSDAPQGLVDRVTRLEAGKRFGSVHEVLDALGICSPETR